MTPPPPFLFYGLIKIGQNEARRIHLHQRVQKRLTAEFLAQKDAFLLESEAIDYDPQYKPDDGEEHFQIKEYALPVAYKKVIEGPDAVPAIETQDFDECRVRCIFGMSQNANKRELFFQNFDVGNVLKRGTSFLARPDRFDELEETAVTLKDRISAYYDGKNLYFRSVNLVSRYLDLDQVFQEATNEQIETFVADKRFVQPDMDDFLAASDSWVRRKISVINARNILDSVGIDDIKRVASEFQVKLTTQRGPSGREAIVLPTDKKELKDLLRLFAQDLLQCAMTNDRFRVNSKARINNSQR